MSDESTFYIFWLKSALICKRKRLWRLSWFLTEFILNSSSDDLIKSDGRMNAEKILLWKATDW